MHRNGLGGIFLHRDNERRILRLLVVPFAFCRVRSREGVFRGST